MLPQDNCWQGALDIDGSDLQGQFMKPLSCLRFLEDLRRVRHL